MYDIYLFMLHTHELASCYIIWYWGACTKKIEKITTFKLMNQVYQNLLVN